MIVTFEALDYIAVNGSLLNKVGEYLDSAGRDDLAQMLFDLQNDASGIEKASALPEAYENIPPERLFLFHLIEQELEERGGTLHSDFSGFYSDLKELTAPEQEPDLGESTEPQGFLL